MKTNLKENIKKISKAREDVSRILDRYQVTLPEIMGIVKTEESIDEQLWQTFQKDYERIQENTFAETHPKLWRRAKKN